MKLHKILYLLPALTLVACNSDDDLNDTLSGNGKTPLSVTALLDANGKTSQTRAADKEFANGDQMVAYLRHVTWNGGFTTAEADKRTPVAADQAPMLVTFTCTGSEAWNNAIDDILPFRTDKTLAITGTGSNPDTKQAAGLTATPSLYWDDFSESSVDGNKDLRTDGHYLQSYYGYCYNGGTPVSGTELDSDAKKAIGQIGWAVQTNQTEGFKTSDLLWSPEQEPVSYAHRDNNVDSNRPGLIIPYTHAMSKVTIKVTAGEGFATSYNFTGTGIALNDVRVKCTAIAPTAQLTYATDGSDKDNVQMQPGDGTGTRSFQAIIVPSILTVGNTFATITNMDGNTYTIPVTESMVKVPGSDEFGWGAQLTDDVEDVDNGTAQARPQTRADIPMGSGHQMKSGVHYVLNVTLKKTEINVSATILDWEEVEAEGVGEIHFANDIKETGEIVEALRANDIDIYQCDYVDEATTPTFDTKSTTLHWNKTSREWKYDPVIYWKGGTKEYFRAISGDRFNATNLNMVNGYDALWGTTEGLYGYEEGKAVDPRTGDVPLKFYHAMSKITFNLVDAYKDYSDESSHIELANATIQLTNLATGGMIELNKGVITPSSVSDKTFSEDTYSVPARMGYYAAMENGIATTYTDYRLADYIITPQTITNDAIVVVTLADGSVYKAQLNKCTTNVTADGQTTSQYITKWEQGKSYTYTITLGKETITFRALIEDWDPVDGGGKATLEWD